MIFKNLWERHLLYQLLKTFLFSVGCFYILYIIIDCSIHSRHFSKSGHLLWSDLGTYYFYLLMKRADLILPLACVISTNKVLLGLNQSHAMIALSMGGLHKFTLLRPFFTVAWLVAILLLLNFEYITPKALSYLESFEYQNFKKQSTHNYSIPSTYNLSLQDGSHLIFSKYDAEQRCFEDVYYVISVDEIWKMKHLELMDEASQGYYVEHLVRNGDHLLIKDEEYATFLFPYFSIDVTGTSNALIPLEHRSISSLYAMVGSVPLAHVVTQLGFKLSIPFVSFLFIITCTPFCITFSRKLPIFMIYAMSIFGVIAFFIVMDAAVILGEHQTVSPWIAIAFPYVLCLVGFGKKFINIYLK